VPGGAVFRINGLELSRIASLLCPLAGIEGPAVVPEARAHGGRFWVADESDNSSTQSGRRPLTRYSKYLSHVPRKASSFIPPARGAFCDLPPTGPSAFFQTKTDVQCLAISADRLHTAPPGLGATFYLTSEAGVAGSAHLSRNRQWRCLFQTSFGPRPPAITRVPLR